MTNLQEIKNKVSELSAFGIKGTELFYKITRYFKGDVLGNEIDLAIKELITENKIIEIEYILPHMDYRIKTFYVPTNTRFNIPEFK